MRLSKKHPNPNQKQRKNRRWNKKNKKTKTLMMNNRKRIRKKAKSLSQPISQVKLTKNLLVKIKRAQTNQKESQMVNLIKTQTKANSKIFDRCGYLTKMPRKAMDQMPIDMIK